MKYTVTKGDLSESFGDRRKAKQRAQELGDGTKVIGSSGHYIVITYQGLFNYSHAPDSWRN